MWAGLLHSGTTRRYTVLITGERNSTMASPASSSTNEFLKFVHQKQVLQFGNFTLKSGRRSPYFFNAGLFNSGSCLSQLGDFYAKAIHDSKLEFDLIFGPAYKGIPLAVATTVALYKNYGTDVPYVFNRKEIKDHGEGGLFIGATDLLKGASCRVLVVDDVVTAGSALREVIAMLEPFPGCRIVGVVISLDREERIDEQSPFKTAVSSLTTELGAPVISIAKFSDLVNFVRRVVESPQSPTLCTGIANADILSSVEQFREKYGATNQC